MTKPGLAATDRFRLPRRYATRESKQTASSAVRAQPVAASELATVWWPERHYDLVRVELYPIVYLDALLVKVRDEGHIQNKAIYVVLGVSQQRQFWALGLLEAVGLASRRSLEAPRYRKVGGSVVCGGGQMYSTGRPGNQNGNSGANIA
jgi:hypothetical protein